MEKRKRFKAERICSSDNYELSKKAHRNYLKRTKEVTSTIFQYQKETKYYINCFGEMMEITREEALSIKETVKVITYTKP